MDRFGQIRTGTCCVPNSARFSSACHVQSLHLFWSSHFRLRCAGYLQCCSQYPCGGKSCILKCSTCRWFFSSSPYSCQKKLQINSKLSTRFQNLYTYIFIYAIQGGPEEFAVKVSTEIGHVPASIWPPEIERPRPQQGQHITWAMLTGWW